jgi:hypothetical protein
MKKYRLADLVNGAFGDTFDSIEAAESALAEAIQEGKKANREASGTEEGSDGVAVEDFFSIVEA